MGRNVAVWGAGGFIGSALIARGHIPVLHGDPISRPGESLAKLGGIIWAAGWAGRRNVDDVEDNPARGYLQNVAEPIELAARCAKYGIRLLIIASGCVYNGLNRYGFPHRETDPMNFTQTAYLTQQSARFMALHGYQHITTFRIRVPFDDRHHPRNTLHKLVQMAAVWDVPQSYTWVPDLRLAVRAWESGIIDGGTWHITQTGTMNNFDAVRQLNPEVKRISHRNDRPEPTMKCARSTAILNNQKICAVVPMLPVGEAWKRACEGYLKLRT